MKQRKIQSNWRNKGPYGEIFTYTTATIELKISSGIDLDHMGNNKNHGIVSLLSDVLPENGGMQVFNSRNTPSCPSEELKTRHEKNNSVCKNVE